MAMRPEECHPAISTQAGAERRLTEAQARTLRHIAQKVFGTHRQLAHLLKELDITAPKW
jgi:hypothetical protein